MLNRNPLCGVIAVIVLGAGPRAALSQSGAPSAEASSAGQLEEVIVTARKTTESLQKAPASIAVASGAELQTMGITNPQELQMVLPSASLHTNGAVTQTFIRGIGTRVDSLNFASSSIMLFNGIILPRYGTGGVLFDLANTQSIAGPQGTLYGGTAAGGAININSVQPQHDFSGSGLLEGGTYNEAHVGVAQNVPMGDVSSLRAAVDYERHSGYESFGIDGLNRVEGRLSLLTKPAAGLDILVFFDGYGNNGAPAATLNTIPNRFPNNAWQFPAVLPNGIPVSSGFTSQNNKTYIAGANVNWQVGDNLFTYIPGYVNVLVDQGNYYFGGTGNLLHIRDREDQHSEELRWSRPIGAWQLSAGAFYLRDASDVFETLGVPGFKAPPYWKFSGIVQELTTDTNYAAFAQAVYSATDRLRLTLGGRESWDRVSASGFSSGKPFVFDGSENRPDWKVGVDYDLTPQVLTYANVQTGYIPFGYNPDAVTASPVTQATTVPLSDLRAYSTGVKSRFLDNRIQINEELYYYIYKHFQAIAFVTATAKTTVLDAEVARIYGADTSVQVALPYHTRFDTDFVIQSAHYSEFQGVGYDFSGNQMVNAPAVSATASLQHTQSVGSAGSLTGRIDAHYDSGHYGNFNNFPNGRQPAFVRTNLSLMYSPPRAPWSLQLYVDNVSNVIEYGTPSPGSTPTAVATAALAAPRTYGVRFYANWD